MPVGNINTSVNLQNLNQATRHAHQHKGHIHKGGSFVVGKNSFKVRAFLTRGDTFAHIHEQAIKDFTAALPSMGDTPLKKRTVHQMSNKHGISIQFIGDTLKQMGVRDA